MGEKKKFVIDVDCGIDDADALCMAISSPAIEIVGITCVSGNCQVNQVLINTLRVLRACDRLDIPVYKGCSKPLIGYRKGTRDGTYFHGRDGLGNSPDPEGDVDLSLIKKESAVDALIRLSQMYQDELVVVALAPLTNLAVALRIDDEFAKRIKELYIMGGNLTGVGNVSRAAEFNFYSDPESAKIVLKEYKCPITMICWEPCSECPLSWEWYDRITTGNSKKCQFHNRIYKSALVGKRNMPNYYACDPIAMAVAIDNDVASETTLKNCDVNTSESLTRGQMSVDLKNDDSLNYNAKIVLKLDTDKLSKLYEAAFDYK
ncbi:DgyrCDS1585 [Dimorphilus gyrociliatus]|uniref:DgyrCDS1585 n=1 Tax=Dimorphilus gyrociliatus TaxID=2664684 RepID=A0A7I8VAY6_9ANNE|nr:DgyrCDS1585 [Dimorphilus gyrociliatus]